MVERKTAYSGGNMKACIQCMKRIDEVELQQIVVTQPRDVEVLDVAAVYCCTDCVEELRGSR